MSIYQDDPVGFCTEELGEVLTDDVKQMMNSVRDNPVTVAVSANAVGKTHGAARVAVWFYKCFEDSQVYTAAAPPIDNLKTLLWGEIGSITRSHPLLFVDDYPATMRIADEEVHPRSFIVGRTIPTSGTPEEREAKFSGKHAPHLLFIFDEGDAIPDEVYKGAEACMSGGHTRMLIMFNPKRKSGYVYKMIKEGKVAVVELSAFNHPNVVSGRQIIPGAVDRNTTVRRINEWTVPLGDSETPGVDCFEVPEFLVGARAYSKKGELYPPLPPGWRRVIDAQFHYMVLGQYPPHEVNQLISREWIDNARARWDAYVAQYGMVPPKGIIGPVLGLDVADDGDDYNSLCERYGGFVKGFRKWKGVDPDMTAIKASQIHKELQAEATFADSIGVGAGVVPRMRRLGCSSAFKVKASEAPTKSTEMGEFGTLRDQLCWEVREWLRKDPGAMLPPDDELIEELEVLTYRIDAKTGKIKVMPKDQVKAKLGRSPDKFDSLKFTFHTRESGPRVRML